MKSLRTKEIKITCDGKEVGEFIEFGGDESSGRIYLKVKIVDPDMVAKLLDELSPREGDWIKHGLLLQGTVDVTRAYPEFEFITED